MMSLFKKQYQIQLDDLDFMNIVGHTQWLTILERARVDFLSTLNYPFSDMLKKRENVVVANITISYKAPAYYPDNIDIFLTAKQLGASSFSAHSQIKRQNKLLVEADIKLVCVNQQGRPVEIPPPLRSALTGQSKNV